MALEGRISVLPREISPPLQAYRSRVPATASFDEALKAALRHGGGGDGRAGPAPAEEPRARTAWDHERALTQGSGDALRQAREYLADRYEIVVDLDLEKFFDRVNHDILMARLARRIGDKRLLHIVRRFLQAGMMVNGVCEERPEGTPQGGLPPPLLANLLPDDLDKELESRGHRFCRYADDCNIYVRSQAAGDRVMASVTAFLEGKLRLKVNQSKSAVAPVGERRFPGYRLDRLGLAQGVWGEIITPRTQKF